MKILIKIQLILLTALLLTACLKNEGSNYQTFADEPLIVSSTFPGTVLSTRFPNASKFYAPMLDEQNLNVGQCLYASFNINYDNQPTTDYYTISELYGYSLVDSTYAVFDTTQVAYDIAIRELEVFGSTSGSFVVDSTMVFIVFSQDKSPQGKASYRMIFSDKTVGSSSVNPWVYVSAQSEAITEENPDNAEELKSLTGSTETEVVVYAFDIGPFLKFLGGTPGKTLNIDVKCYTGKDGFKTLGVIRTTTR